MSPAVAASPSAGAFHHHPTAAHGGDAELPGSDRDPCEPEHPCDTGVTPCAAGGCATIPNVACASRAGFGVDPGPGSTAPASVAGTGRSSARAVPSPPPKI